jgi:hypothetical protein
MLSFIYTGSIDNIADLHLPSETDDFLDPVASTVITYLQLLKVADMLNLPLLQTHVSTSLDNAPIKLIRRDCIPRFLEQVINLTDADSSARKYIVRGCIQALCEGDQNEGLPTPKQEDNWAAALARTLLKGLIESTRVINELQQELETQKSRNVSTMEDLAYL